MLEKILHLSEEKKAQLGCIYDIRDESDREGLRAVIELKKEANPEKVLAFLYKYSDLQVTFGVNMVAIADGKPVQMGLKAIIGYFIKHQKDVITRRTRFELDQAKARAHILQGLMIAVDNLDEVIRLIRASKTPKEAKQRLMEAFELDDVQAQAILDMRLQRLTNLEILALRKEYEDLLKLIDRLEGILKSEKKLLAVIRKELEEIAAEHNDPRRTAIEVPGEVVLTPEDEQPIPDECVIAYTCGGALKRVYPANYRKQPLPSLKEDQKEAARFLFNTQTDHTLLIFTDRGNCYPLSVGKLTECKPRDRGQQLSALLAGLEDGETAVYMDCVRMNELTGKPDYLFVSHNGQTKRVQAAEFDVRSKKIVTMNLKNGDTLRFVLPLINDGDILLVSKAGMGIRFPQDTVPVQGRSSAGVKGIALEAGDEVIACGLTDSGSELVVFTDRGYGKRIPAVELEKQNRGGKGARLMPFNKNGSTGTCLAGAVLCGKEPAELLLTQKSSQPTVLQKDEIRPQRKTDKGTPYVMALLEDIVTGLEKLPSP